MKLRTIYETAVRKGIKEDQRSKKVIDDTLKKAKKEYGKTRGIDRKYFDRDRFFNPYADTRILNGTGEEEVSGVMVGIDIGVPELILADRLREKGSAIDLVISHHPLGKALAGLPEVMSISSDLWTKLGMEGDIAHGMMKERISEVTRGVSSANHTRAQDAARILGIPLMCIHTAADNCVAAFLQRLFDSQKPRKVKNVITLLKNIPEYREAIRTGVGPHILIGKEDDTAGKVFVDMTGGTSPTDKMFARLSAAGVKTFVGMHCRESGYKTAKQEFVNYVIAGHMASDTLGLNLVLDAVEKRGKLECLECSGFKRVKRKK